MARRVEKGWHGDEGTPPGVARLGLDAPPPASRAGVGEGVAEAVVGAEGPGERAGVDDGAATPPHFGRVVEGDPPGHAPHGLGHVLGTLAGALRGLAPEGLGSADIGVGRARRGALAPRDGAPCPVVRLAETRPALSWPPLELGEAPPIASVPLACRLPPARPHAALGGWVRARVARLALESREDPGGRVPLPAPRLGVFLEPPVDGRLEGLERGTRRAAPVREPGRWVSHIPIPSRRWLRDLAGPRNMSDGLAPSR